MALGIVYKIPIYPIFYLFRGTVERKTGRNTGQHVKYKGILGGRGDTKYVQ